jgi:hypothetical protein
MLTVTPKVLTAVCHAWSQADPNTQYNTYYFLDEINKIIPVRIVFRFTVQHILYQCGLNTQVYVTHEIQTALLVQKYGITAQPCE